MIKLILVRHGKTTCNEKGVLSGLTDSVLSETGKLQSQKIADYLKYTNIDKIYTTPFKRTKETIEKSTPKIRYEVGKRIRLRLTPELKFVYTDSLEKGSRVSEIIDKISRGEI